MKFWAKTPGVHTGNEERGTLPTGRQIYTRPLASVRNISYIRAMLRAYKYALFPDQEQSVQLAKTFGCCRFVYNAGLETKNTAYRMRGVNLTCFDLIKQATEAKKELTWLSEVPSQALQMALRNLDNAFTNFFRHGAAFPRFKSKYRKQSFQLPQGVKVDFDGGKIFLPKCKWVAAVLHRKFEGTIKTTTVSRTATGKYFVSVLVDMPICAAKLKSVNPATAVGLDLGIKTFLVTSDGEEFKNQKFLSRNLKRLRVEQRSLARKEKGSQNRQKQRLVVAKLHEKIRNQRSDYLHKLSTDLLNRYGTLCFEDLHVKGMVRNRPLARSISEQGWAEFRRMCDYKAETYGKHVIQIGRFEPSSKMCSTCGATNHQLTLKDRSWQCSSCSTVHDRDLNAAINIKDFGCRSAPRGGRLCPLTWPTRACVGQEALAF